MTTQSRRAIPRQAPASDEARVAELGRRALSQTNIEIVMEDALELVRDRLDTEFVKILELVPSGEGFLLTAGIGWRPGYVGQVVVPLMPESQAGYTMEQGETILVEDLASEKRFRGMPLLHEHAIVSGISTVMRGHDKAHGIMTAHSAQRLRFNDDDVAFFEAVAAVVADALDRRETEERLEETNQRLSVALQAGRMGSWEWNPHTGRVIWSEQVERTYGLRPGEFPGTVEAYFGYIHPEDKDRVARTIREALEGGQLEMEYRIVRPSGEVRWLFARGLVKRDARGDPLRVVGICYDSTEDKQAERALREAEEKYRTLFERLARLQAITSALSEAATPSRVAEVIIENAARALEADGGAVRVLTEDGLRLRLLGYTGFDAERMAQFEELTLDSGFPPTEAIRTRSPVFIESLEEMDRGHYRRTESVGFGAAAFMPLHVEDRVIGTMTVHFANSHTFSDDDRAILFALSLLCAQAMDRARLFEAEGVARAEAEEAERRQAFLAESSAILSSSLDYGETLTTVAGLCVPFFADWCAIDILDGEEVVRVAVVHSDPAKIEYAHQLRERYPPDIEREGAMRQVIQTGTSFCMPDITEGAVREMLRSQGREEELVDIVLQLGLRSALIVPLKARGRVLGVLTLVTAESSRRFSPDDVALAEELGHRAGLAVENARLYGESQTIQEELRKANEAKDEFLGLVSHELRTPITTIFGGARLLRSRGDNLDVDSRASVLADIEQESERLHRIVEDLLVLARIELGQEVVTEPILVQRIIERTVASFGKRRPGRTIDVRTSSVSRPVRGSAIYLEQTLRNLINNADKYSPPEPAIEIEAQGGDGEIIISVMDRGPGIPPEEMDRIFERWYRSEGTAKQAGGAGIGLTVCQRLIEAQGGRIWAELREGGGLKVSFSLPLYIESHG